MRKSLLLGTAALGIAMLPLGAAEAQVPFDWSGFYGGLHGGFLSGDVTLCGFDTKFVGLGGGCLEFGDVLVGGSISGPIGGFLGGFNFDPIPGSPVFFSLEADIGFGDISGNGIQEPSDDIVSEVYDYELNWNKHIRLRGVYPMGTFAPFVAGGLAIADFNVSEGYGESDGGIYTGATFGVGVDALLGPRFIGRVEGLVDIYGSKSYEEYEVDLTTWTLRFAGILKLP